MPFIEWEKRFDTEIETVDNQHKKLVAIINRLHEALVQLKTEEVLAGVLTELVEYTEYHFNTEEELFEKHKYPETVAHKVKHRRFIIDITKFKNDYRAGNKSISLKLTAFLKDWLLNHIARNDKAFADFIKNKK